MNKKKCTKCNEFKAIDDFYTKGQGKRDSKCKTCAKKERRLRYVKRKRKNPISFTIKENFVTRVSPSMLLSFGDSGVTYYQIGSKGEWIKID